MSMAQESLCEVGSDKIPVELIRREANINLRLLSEPKMLDIVAWTTEDNKVFSIYQKKSEKY